MDSWEREEFERTLSEYKDRYYKENPCYNGECAYSEYITNLEKYIRNKNDYEFNGG